MVAHLLQGTEDNGVLSRVRTAITAGIGWLTTTKRRGLLSSMQGAPLASLRCSDLVPCIAILSMIGSVAPPSRMDHVSILDRALDREKLSTA